jgi:predicted membrane protein
MYTSAIASAVITFIVLVFFGVIAFARYDLEERDIVDEKLYKRAYEYYVYQREKCAAMIKEKLAEKYSDFFPTKEKMLQIAMQKEEELRFIAAVATAHATLDISLDLIFDDIILDAVIEHEAEEALVAAMESFLEEEVAALVGLSAIMAGEGDVSNDATQSTGLVEAVYKTIVDGSTSIVPITGGLSPDVGDITPVADEIFPAIDESSPAPVAVTSASNRAHFVTIISQYFNHFKSIFAPKIAVKRVLTPEELEEIAVRKQLELDAAIAKWTTVHKRTLNSFLTSLIPPQFQTGYWRDVLWKWLLLDHPWICLVAAFNGEREYRVTKWIIASSKFVTFLFFTSILVRYIFPDDGSCELYKSRDTCNSATTIIGIRNTCHWDAPAEWCHFTQPSLDFVTLVVCAFVVTVLTIPVIGVLEYCIHDAHSYAKVLLDKYAMVKKEEREGKALEFVGEDIPVEDELRSLQSTRSILLCAARLHKMQEYAEFALSPYEAEMLIRMSNEEFLRLNRSCLVTSNLKKRLDMLRSPTVRYSRYWYYAANKMDLVRKIEKARSEAMNIKYKLTYIHSDADKETLLLREFIVNLFAGYRRNIVRRYLLDPYEPHTPFKESQSQIMNFIGESLLNIKDAKKVIAGVLAVVIVVIELAVCLNVIASIGTRSVAIWFIVVFIALLEDVLFLQTLKIWLKYIVFPSLVSKEVREILRLIERRYNSIMRRVDGQVCDANACLMQHFNPACRVAHVMPELPLARFLIALNDYDIPYFTIVNYVEHTISFESIFNSIVSFLLLLITVTPNIVEDMIIESIGCSLLTVTMILLYVIGVASPLISVGIVLTSAGYMAHYEYKQYKLHTDVTYATKMQVKRELGVKRWKRFKQLISKKKKVQVAVDEDEDVDLNIFTEKPPPTIFETRMKPRAVHHPPGSVQKYVLKKVPVVRSAPPPTASKVNISPTKDAIATESKKMEEDAAIQQLDALLNENLTRLVQNIDSVTVRVKNVTRSAKRVKSAKAVVPSADTDARVEYDERVYENVRLKPRRIRNNFNGDLPPVRIPRRRGPGQVSRSPALSPGGDDGSFISDLDDESVARAGSPSNKNQFPLWH